MNKRLIRLTEGDLHRIVKESVNRILNEDDDALKQRQMQRMWDKQYGQRPDMNSKRSKKRFDWNNKQGYDFDPLEREGENATKEFLNRPNAANDFKHFPRKSQHNETNFDTLKNGSEKIRALRRKREDEKEEQKRRMVSDKRKKAENALWSIGNKVIQSGYDPSSLTEKEVNIINSLITDNEACGGEVFPEFSIDNKEGVWFALLMSYMNEYVGYNPYKAALLAHKLGLTNNIPKSKEMDVDLLPANHNNEDEYDWY
jgi:hypothetical protein